MTHLQASSLTVVNQCSSIDFPGTVLFVPIAGELVCYFFGGGGSLSKRLLLRFFFNLIIFEDGKVPWLKSKICVQANRQHGSVEICSPVACCVENISLM